MMSLKVWQKLGLLGAAFTIPLLFVTWKLMTSIEGFRVEPARQEVRGLKYYIPLRELLSDLQQHRGMANAWLSGDASFGEKLMAKRADIDKDLQAVATAEREQGAALQTRAHWQALQVRCRDLLEKFRNLSAPESFALHSQAIDAALNLIALVGDASKLTADPDAGSYSLANIVVFQSPQLGEFLARARGVGARVAASRSLSPEQSAALTGWLALANYLQQKTDAALVKVFAVHPPLKPRLEADRQAVAKAVRDADDQVSALIARGGAHTNAAEYFSAMTGSIDAVSEVEGRLIAALQALLEQRVASSRRELRQTFIWTACGLLLAALTAFLIMRDITQPLGRVVGVADRVAAGDLDVQAEVESRQDEFGVLGRAFRHMARELAGTVGGVQKSSVQVGRVMVEIAAMSRQQNATANEVAATTAEVGATSREISATSKALARTMNEVATLTADTADLAGLGQTGVRRMEDTMRQIMEAGGSIKAKLAALNEQAGHIGQVVTTMVEVADRTNLLSLNAAIEAEKAGEYGRGFAVVATEIRRLADQTAVSTHDIEQMVSEIQSAVAAGVTDMDRFSEQVHRGMQDVTQAGGQLSQIIQQVQTLAPRFEGVNEGMRAQANGAEQISQALAQLSEAARHTVESLRQSSQAIEDLSQVSGGLRDNAARFRLRA